MCLFAAIWHKLNKNCGAEFVLAVSRIKRNAAHDVDLQRWCYFFGNAGQVIEDQRTIVCSLLYTRFCRYSFGTLKYCVLVLFRSGVVYGVLVIGFWGGRRERFVTKNKKKSVLCRGVTSMRS